MTTGYVHSVESGSFVDGPGIRFVVFLAGCPLRCLYCHNPDTWKIRAEQETEADAVLGQIERVKEFLIAGCGGVTISGGEPLTQPEFALEILKGAKAMGLHTALDTSGCLGERMTEEMLAATDLVILDIKSYDEATYRELTGAEVGPTLRLAQRLSEVGKPMWVRFVVVPGVTDEPSNVEGLARFVAGLRSAKRVEVVAFHQMGKHKWEELGIPYELARTPTPTDEEIERVKAVFAAEGLPVGDGEMATCAPPGRAAAEEPVGGDQRAARGG